MRSFILFCFRTVLFLQLPEGKKMKLHFAIKVLFKESINFKANLKYLFKKYLSFVFLVYLFIVKIIFRRYGNFLSGFIYVLHNTIITSSTQKMFFQCWEQSVPSRWELNMANALDVSIFIKILTKIKICFF